MASYKVQPPNNGKTQGSNAKDPFRWPPEKKKKIIIASAVGGSSLLIVWIIIAVLLAGAVAYGATGLIADSPEVIEDARRIVVIDDEDKIPEEEEEIIPEENVELPSAYDNSAAYPTPSSQGQQGSCTAWATAYALKSAQEKIEHGWEYSVQSLFSPAYVYNQINGGRDSGSAISEAMKLITEQGACTLSDMPYNDGNYIKQPNSYQKEKAFPHRAMDWFTVKGTEQIKAAIYKYGGVVVGINVCSNFNDLNETNPIYSVRKGKNFGGHAICLIGYDDEKNAFKFINSWGTDWGIEGFGWVSYDIVEEDTNIYGAFCMIDLEE